MRSERRRVVGAALGAPLVAAALAFGFASARSAPGFDLAALMALLGGVKSGEATFVETRRIEILDRTLVSSGRLSFKAPDVFVRETLKPLHQKLAVAGNTLTMSLGDRTRTMQLDASPEAAVIVEAIRGTLTGNRAALDRLFETSVAGDSRQWTLELVPREARLRGQVASVRVSGRGQIAREVRIVLADGDVSVMTIEPVATSRGTS